jgi:hypothetical protein
MGRKTWLVLICLIGFLALLACRIGGAGSVTVMPENPTEISTESPTAAPTEAPTEFPKEEPTVIENPPEENDEAESIPEGTPDESLLDAQAMLDRLGDYVLRPGDLPHAYNLPEGGELHMSNQRLINEMGQLEAKTYIRDTGRIDGWWLRLKRTNNDDFAPNAFESAIQLFETAEGAQLAMSPDHYQLHRDESREYQLLDGGCQLGDQCEFYYSEREDPATEVVVAQYNVAFTYKNAFVWVMARGLEIDLEADYVMDAARVVVRKLERAPTR